VSRSGRFRAYPHQIAGSEATLLSGSGSVARRGFEH